MIKEIETKSKKIADEIPDLILEYLKSYSPGGQKVIDAFMDEFDKLSARSPADDPTNLKNHMSFLEKHVKDTWDNSLSLTKDREINAGICEDEVIGFKEDKTKLKHKPTPVMWVVYLIRGIAGPYAFVNPDMYFKKKGEPMPPQYHDGFLISKWHWENEGWGRVLGDFNKYKHPASGAAPIPFFKNVLKKIDMQSIISKALE